MTGPPKDIDGMTSDTGLRRRWACIALALALAVAAAAAVSARPAAARPGPLIGVGEQKAEMFENEFWARLGLRDTRYTVPWDALEDPRQRALLDRWMRAADEAGARVLLGFAHSLRSDRLARTLPTRRQFRRQFLRLRDRYPEVRDWLAWNEANHPGSLTARRPARAAQFFDVIARNCRGCRVVAADVLDIRNMTSWIRRFQRAASATPRIWGLHNYGDVNGLRTQGTRRLLAITRGRIWLTETGAVLLRRTHRDGRLQTFRHSPSGAARRTAHALRLGCLSPRITRMYLYHWQAPALVTNWDSALVDPDGQPRPAYRVVQRWVAPDGIAASRQGRGVPCP